MNIETSIKNLNTKLQQKNFLFITGNIHEEFLGKSRSIKNINQIIVDVVRNNMNHSSVIHWSMNKGSKDLLDDSTNYENKTLENLLRDIVNNINSFDNKEEEKEEPKVYIVDFADVILDGNSQGNEDIVQSLRVLSAILTSQSKNYQQSTDVNKLTKVIFVARNSGNILNFITNQNAEYCEVVINKPDRMERRKLFENLSSVFDITNKNDLRTEGTTLNEAIGLTEGWSNREILQLGRINVNDSLTFKELFYLATLRSKESAWEQLDKEAVLNAEKFLSKRVFGQDYAIKKTVNTLKRSFFGLTGAFQGLETNKPKGILFYCGPTGTGKTELAKSLAEFVFSDKNRLVRFDMSEFGQEHSDQRLLGAPPGYIGFDGGGELTNSIKENPNSIILFDEIEKAHPKILDKFLQILEDGRLTSSKGELINFSETFIIFTSNIGSSTVSDNDSDEKVRNHFIKSVYEKFTNELQRPEILNRIGKENVVPFGFISDPDIQSNMFESKLNKLNEVLLQRKNILLKFESNDVRDIIDILIRDDKYSKKDGGRGLLEIATKYILDPLGEFLIYNGDKIDSLRDGKTPVYLKLEISKKEVTFKI